jgi:cyanophycin synthetase
MAESLARNVYLDAAGIDFISPDIGVPWHKIRCAVIEINAHPGIGDTVARRVIAHRFPDGSDGRIPSFLLVGGSFASLEKISAGALALGRNAGITDEQTTRFGTEQRFFRKASLPERVLSLILEPTCDVLAVSCSMAALSAEGFPQTRFDMVLADADAPLTAGDRELLARGTSTVKYGVSPAQAVKHVLAHLRSRK